MNELKFKPDFLKAHEEQKYRDYTKHISWVYHKTQILPKVVLVGKNSSTVPMRNYKLRICELTRLNPSSTAPAARELFDDYAQLSNFRDLSMEELSSSPKLKKLYLNTQNVVILDDATITSQSLKILNTIVLTEPLLAQHGRFLFDISASASCSVLESCAVFDHQVIDLQSIPAKVLGLVRSVNDILFHSGKPSHFKIEDIKLSIFGDATCLVGLRVYLKKETGNNDA